MTQSDNINRVILKVPEPQQSRVLAAVYGVSIEVPASSKNGGLSVQDALKFIDSAFQHAEIHTIRRELTIVIFPELAVHGATKTQIDVALREYLATCTTHSSDALIVLGVELVAGSGAPNTTNQCAVIFLGSQKGPEPRDVSVYWQDKLTQAREEQSSSSPLRQSKLCVFSYGPISISVLTCSDLFAPLLGSGWTALELIERTFKGVLVVNPQFSRSPDDESVLARLDASFSQGTPAKCVGVLQTNVVYRGVTRHKVGGRILSHTRSNFPSTEKVKGLGTAIRGIEFPWQAGVYFAQCEINATDGGFHCVANAYLPVGATNWDFSPKSAFAIETAPTVRLVSPAKPVQYAKELRRMGEFAAAEKILRSRLNQSPSVAEEVEISRELATLLSHAGRYDDAYHFYSRQYQRFRKDGIERNGNTTGTDFMGALKLLKTLFQMLHTRNYLQLGHLKVHMADLSSLAIRADTLAKSARDGGAIPEVKKEISEQLLNLRRHQLQCIALHDPAQITEKDFFDLESAYAERHLLKEENFLRQIHANWLRASDRFEESREMSKQVLDIARNIENVRLAENALRCLGELAWRERIREKPTVIESELNRVWKQWRACLSTPSSPFVAFYSNFSKLRIRLLQFIENQASIGDLRAQTDLLDDEVSIRYASTSDSVARDLTFLIRHSVQYWETNRVTVADYRDVIDPFVASCQESDFWRIRELSRKLIEVSNDYSLNSWQRALLLPNFQLWG